MTVATVDKFVATRIFVIFCLSSCSSNAQTNVALGKMVRESSSKAPYNGFLVLDGIYTPPYCYVSLASAYQWIQIDLLWSYRVDFVHVFEKLLTNMFNVKLTDLSFKTIAPCPNVTSQLTQTNVSFQCPAEYSSRFVTLDQSATSIVKMNVCEVVVEGLYDDELPQRTNILQGKSVTMISSFWNTNSLTGLSFPMIAGLMVDGIRDPTLLHGHCAHCNEAVWSRNWIQVDMVQVHFIGYVALVSRDASSTANAQRLTNFSIGLTSKSCNVVAPIRGQYPLCAMYPGDVPRATRVTLQCNANLPAYRYIFVHQADGASDAHMAVCELEAFPTDPQIKQTKWRSTKNKQLINYKFMEVQVLKPLQCIKQCMKVGDYSCDSFNYNPALKTCELNKHRNGYQVGNLTTNSSWTFWTARYDYSGNL
ncbi:hypothetical protein HELRODRAFT_193260 [Helobdella robusta]|uniref:Apple domain-containing protein n=1 Tax=Helobdella robusta TaxID=6412 RepID=T1FUT1_HELRO|nr:hypothetical protein HELRODRAFT_193260 [Helobdella robusta]ESN97322.1 hypothetical protein HELRODRAFT_193260 [Helobdella robusta]